MLWYPEPVRTVRSSSPLLAAATLVGALFLAGLATPARADQEADRGAARALAADAKQAFDKSDWTKALDLYRRASQLMPAPTLAIREARCLVRLDKLVEAREAYVRTLRTPIDAKSPPPFRAAVREADAELAAIEPQIPKLRIVVEGKDAKILLDGALVPPAVLNVDIPADPGAHTITGTVEGAAVRTQELTLRRGQRAEVVLQLTEAPKPAPPPIAEPPPATAAAPEPPAEAPVAPPVGEGPSARPLAWVAFGLGAAGLGIGVVTGIIATNKKSSLDAECPGGRCPASASGDVDSFRSMRTVSTTAYVVGLVGVATGVVVFVMTRPSRKAAFLEPGAGDLRVRF